MQTFEHACAAAAASSLRNAFCSIHVNATVALVQGKPAITGFTLSDWYDSATLCTYVNGNRS